MKKQSIKGLAIVAMTSSIVAGCDLLKDLNYTVNPSPLEMHADSVRVSVEVKFPEKGIKKKASAEITPTLAGVPLKTVTVQGEKASGNGSIIQYKPGGSMVYTDVVAYKPEFEYTELMVTGKVFKGGKEKKDKFKGQEIAKGTIITPYLLNKDFKVIYAKDNFQRVTEQGTAAQINFEKAKSIVKPNELKDLDIVDFGTWLQAAQSNPKIAIKTIKITGFASIEGEFNKNVTLTSDRAEAAKTVVKDLALKSGNVTAQGEIYQLAGSGEDFPGFEVELAKNTTMKQEDKELILRVLKMYADPNQREIEMKNLGKSFTDLEKTIFPKLRRSEIKVTYDLTGYSDEELKTLSKTDVQKLTLEEMLFTATLVEDLNDKLNIYLAAEAKDANDWRAFNNAGAVLYMQGKTGEAQAQLEKAAALQKDPIVNNNLAAIAGVSGDREKTKSLLADAKGAGPEVAYNGAIIKVQEGDYSGAVSGFGSFETFNKALAQVLDKNNEGALKTINASVDAESGQGYYLKAIIAARQSKLEDVASNLKSAIGKDAAWKAKAAKDREFLKYADDTSLSFIK